MILDYFIGRKDKNIYDNFIKNFIPNYIDIYIEPFAGTFNLSNYINSNKYIYNDIKTYNFEIKADEIHHLDYSEIIKKYNQNNSFFYFDPPYFNKEHLYGLKRGDFKFHNELKNNIDKLNCKFLLSYNNSNFIKKLYKDYNIVEYSGDDIFLKNEILIFN
jgi:site-specific DNA-adenine methylase